MNDGRGAINFAGGGLYVVGVLTQAGFTVRALGLVGVGAVVVLGTVRYEAALQRWWTRVAAKVERSPKDRRVSPRRVITLLAIATVLIAAFLIGTASGRAVKDDPVLNVNAYARHLGGGVSDWTTDLSAHPGDTLEFLIRFKNERSGRPLDVIVGDNLPKYVAYVAGSTRLRNGNNPQGTQIGNDNITRGGIDVGNYSRGSAGYVWFEVKLDPATSYDKCGGQYDLRNVGLAKAHKVDVIYNTTRVRVGVPCASS